MPREIGIRRRRVVPRSRSVFLALFVVALALLVPAARPALAQEFLVRTYAIADGLPSPDVRGVAQDEAGRLWVATRAGVVCYDGAVWERTGVPEPLPLPDYTALGRDSRGTVWAVSPQASAPVASFDGSSWSFSAGPPAEGAEPTPLTAFAVAGSGAGAVLAVGTSSHGLLVRRGEDWQRYGVAEGLPSASVRDIAAWGGDLFVATTGGLARVSVDGVDRSLTDLLPADRRRVFALCLRGDDAAGRSDPEAILALTNRSLELIEGGVVTTLVDGLDLRGDPSGPCGGVVEDGAGAVYFGASNALWRLDRGGGVLQPLGYQEGLVGEGVNTMLLDRQGILWVGSRRGVSKVVSLRFATYRARHGLLEDEVSALCEPRPGVLVFGHNRGLTILVDGTFRQVPFAATPTESLRVTRVLDLAADNEGGTWIAASELGLGRLSASGALRWYEPESGRHSVSSVAVDGDGVLWVGTRNGVWWLRGDRLVPAAVPGLDGTLVRRIKTDRSGGVYLATVAGGMLEVRGGGTERLEVPGGEVAVGVYDITADRHGRTWVGTSAGLFERVGTALSRPVEAELLTDSPVYFVVEDGRGALWLGTDSGALRWDGSDLRRYTPREGLAGWETNRAAGLVDHDGQVWIGTATGVSRHQPECDRPAAPPPLVAVTAVVVGGHEVVPGDPIRLSRRDRSVTFRYRAVSFVDEDAVRVSHRLEGLESVWTTPLPDQSREVRYSGLPAGRYRFQVRARNADGVWSEVAESGTVTAAGPLWTRWWFAGTIAGLTVVLLVAVMSVVERWRWASRLESEVAERTDELRESEERYRRLFSDVALAKLLLEPASRTILDVNPSAEELIGLGREGLLGRRVDEVGAVWLVEGVQRLLHAPETAPPGQVEVTAQLAGGVRVVEATANPIAIHGRRHLLVNLRDVTERRRLEEERLRSSKLESLSLLAGGLAHDFNNILTAALGNLSLAEVKVGDGGDPSANFTAAESALLRAKGLTSQLLAFARGGAPVRKTANLHELIRDTCSFVLAGSRSRAEILVEEGLWPATVDSDQLSQVLGNLLVNASQAMEDGGRITVRAENATVEDGGNGPLGGGPFVRVTVADTGVGIPPENLSRVFDPYFTTKASGSGLGLAVSYAIVRRHGGDITLSSVQGRGTTVSVLVPASPGATVVPPAGRFGSTEGKGRVLVMDDMPELRQLYRQALVTLGYEPAVASDGEEAVRLYREALAGGCPFACVIMDLTVPGGMGGTAALAELKRVDPGVRAIVASGYSNDPALEDFQAAGFAGRLAKPFTFSEMGRVVEEVLSRGV